MIENISTLSHTKELHVLQKEFLLTILWCDSWFPCWRLYNTCSLAPSPNTLYLEHNTLSLDRSRNTLYLKHNTHSLAPLTLSTSNTTHPLSSFSDQHTLSQTQHALYRSLTQHSISNTNLILFKGLWVWWTEGEKNMKPRRLPPRLLLQKQMVKRPCHQVLLQKITEQVSRWNIRTIFNLF